MREALLVKEKEYSRLGDELARLRRSSTHKRVVAITIVEGPERIERILEPLRDMAPNALMVVQEVEVSQEPPSRKVYLT